MSKIYFFAPTGFTPPDNHPIYYHASWHTWQADGAQWVFGVAEERRVEPHVVADMLTTLGATVLPGMKHPSPPDIPDDVVAALAPHGVKKGDKTLDIAQKIADKSGHPMLKPSYF